MPTTSLTLLERLAQGGDDEAWNRFVDLYTPLLVGWCRRSGMSDVDAADMIQQVFLTLYEKLPAFQYRPQGSFRAWLKTVLLNAWRNQQRKNARAAGELDPETLAGGDPRLELDEAEYRVHLVRRALEVMQDQFEPATWRACWEFVVQERPAAEVAAELGLTVNAVYLAKSRVLRRLREELRCFWD